MRKYMGAALAAAITLGGGSVAAQDWNGFYVGGSAAMASMTAEVPPVVSYKESDISGTVFAGYNHQMSANMLVGIEAEYSIGSMSTFPFIPIDVENSFGARARIGYTMDNVMIYGTLGAEVATFGPVGAPSNITDTTAGLSIGAGVEYALNEKISVRAEYTYTDFGEASPTYFSGIEVTIERIRLGVAYHF